MLEKCPYCYRPENTWKKDPILLPNGSKYKWQDEITLVEESNIEKRFYKGFDQITYEEVKELQDYLKSLEEENLDEEDRIEFSPLNTSGIFQITGKHIKEMRDSIEKLLDALGLTKTDYFNYDEDGNYITHPLGDKVEWTDPITEAIDLEKFQVKYIHIEDLRHFIQSLWRETWENSELGEYFRYDTIQGLMQSWNVGGTSDNPGTKVEIYLSDDNKKMKITYVDNVYTGGKRWVGTTPILGATYPSLNQNSNIYFDLIGIIPEGYDDKVYAIILQIQVMTKNFHPFYGYYFPLYYVVEYTTEAYNQYSDTPSYIFLSSGINNRNIYDDINLVYGIEVADDIGFLSVCIINVEGWGSGAGATLIADCGDVKLIKS